MRHTRVTSVRWAAVCSAAITLSCATSGEQGPNLVGGSGGSTSIGTGSQGPTSGDDAGVSPPTGGASNGTGGTGSGGTPNGGETTDAGDSEPDSTVPPTTAEVTVTLRPETAITEPERINFAVPLPTSLLEDASKVAVFLGEEELPIALRALGTHPDGSVRSVQVQTELAPSEDTELRVVIGQAPSTESLELVPVSETLVTENGTQGPRVWAALPAEWLTESGVAGPQRTEASVQDTDLSAWSRVCAYEEYDVEAFLDQQDNAAVWLFDRSTVNYLGYVRRGDFGTLETAYREVSIYRDRLSENGDTADIGVPGKVGDAKYYYTQGMALHYLLTGDERFRESAERIANRVSQLWNPVYDGGFWTERHAGFALLAYVWAATISDDQADNFWSLADDAVSAYRDLQETYPAPDDDARCFAHGAEAHGEDYGYNGCSPWMSAILADGLESYARERGGQAAEDAREGIIKLGRFIAEEARDGEGRPYYWAGVHGESEVDPYDEHWGEGAYVVGMAWYYSGKQDAALKAAADELVEGFAEHGVAPHMRSANWQCRSAVAAPYYLSP